MRNVTRNLVTNIQRWYQNLTYLMFSIFFCRAATAARNFNLLKTDTVNRAYISPTGKIARNRCTTSKWTKNITLGGLSFRNRKARVIVIKQQNQKSSWGSNCRKNDRCLLKKKKKPFADDRGKIAYIPKWYFCYSMLCRTVLFGKSQLFMMCPQNNFLCNLIFKESMFLFL